MKIAGNIQNMRRALIALAIAFPGLYLVFAIVAFVHDYRGTLARAESDVSNISSTLNEHAVRTIGEADSRLQATIDEIARRRLVMPGTGEREIYDILTRHARNLPQIVGLIAVDADGWERVSSLSHLPGPIDVHDREYYRYHLTHPGPELYISRPIRNRDNGKWTIPLTRRISNPDGSLNMIIIFGIDLNYFARFYSTLHVGEQGRLSLSRLDGWILMESPLRESDLDISVANTPMFTDLRHAPAGTFFVEHSVIDNTARIVGYASSTQYPIVAAVAVSRDYVLEASRDRIKRSMLIGIFSIAILEALIMLSWRRLRDLATTQDSLARQNDALAASRRRYQELVDGIDGIVWDAALPDVRFTYVSGNAAAISGYPAEEWLSNPRFWEEKLADIDGGQCLERLLASRSESAVLPPIEHRVIAPDGRTIWLRSNIMVAVAPGAAVHLRGITVDVTRQKAFEQELFQATHVDGLTGLPNRVTLLAVIERAIVAAARTGAWVGVILIDLDHFKTINDSLGHEKGDKTLCSVAERLKECLGPNDFLARLGGDEFVVVMENFGHSVIGVELLAERISQAFSEAITIDGHELYIGFSMGISLLPKDAPDCMSLRRHADTALYRAKAAGRNCWCFFDESMTRQVERRLELETALRRAIERNEFQLFFQPQHSLETGRAIGVETLLRWSRPGVGPVSPEDFLPLAEESGQIVPIGTWILQTACEYAVAWRTEYRLPLRMAVNVAAKQIHHKDFVELVRRTLERTGLEPHRLELEITESSIVENLADTVDKLRQIKALGVAIAVDDFGTGYSSLSYLKDLPLDRLKIDRSFVRDIPLDAKDCAIVRTIIALARNLGLSVIAEGVETREQLDFLQHEGCDEIQGYLLSRPLAANALISQLGRMAPTRAAG